jgi:hypothetical protein
LSVARVRAEYSIGMVLGAIFVGLGVYAWIYYFTVSQTMSHMHSIYSNYLVLGLALIAFGGLMLRLSYPFFFPLKSKNWQSAKHCPYCGVLVESNILECQKCQRTLPTEDNYSNAEAETPNEAIQ